MTDRELLELAAKAAGIDLTDANWGGSRDGFYWCEGAPTGHVRHWSPLTDDGDALRLVVKLRLHVSVFADAIGIGTTGRGYCEDKWKDDPYVATRRAIVRAAAEIGRSAS